MSIAQQILLKKLISLCKIKGWDASKIDSRGMCKGIDLYQGLQSHILGKEKDFFETLEHFGAWDEQKGTLSPEIEKAAAELFKCVMLQWELHNSTIKFQLRSAKLLELFLEKNAINIPPLKQKFFMGYVFNQQELKITLERILKPQQITLIGSTSIGHDIEVSYHEKPQPHYELYNSEYPEACKQQFVTLDDLVLAVIKSTFAMVQQTDKHKSEDIFLFSAEEEEKEEQTQMPPLNEFPLTITVLSNQEKYTYPQAIDLIKEFIVKRNEINTPAAYDGVTPLALAATWGDVPLVQFLLAQGANKDIPDQRQKLPFHHAIESGDLTTVKLLYSFQLYDNEELNPLCKAARVGYLDIVDFLFEKKCDKYFTHPELGFFPLIFAIQNGRLEIIKYFNDNTIDYKIIMSIYNNAVTKNLLVIQIILKKHPIISFIELASKKIAILKAEYETKRSDLEKQPNAFSVRNILEKAKLEFYEIGLEQLAEAIFQNPLQDIMELKSEIFEEGVIFGRIKELISDLSQDQQTTIDKLKPQPSSQSITYTNP